MSVHIKQIDVEKIGPLDRFSLAPRLVNLIYGRNEQGKTHLVEFLIRSLFRTGKSWTLREQAGRGKVVVQGLSPNDEIFSPNKSEKIEDFWAQSEGLPPHFNRLLVVKGAEVEFDNDNTAPDKAVIKRYLSNQELLDHIQEKGINSATILKCEISEGTIIGDNKGVLKDRSDYFKRLTKIDSLFDQIARGYTGGLMKELRLKQTKLSEQCVLIEAAKRYAAFELDQKLKQIEAQKKQIDEETLREIRKELTLYRDSLYKYNQKTEQRKQAADSSRHFEWLKNAIGFYRENLKQPTRNLHWIWVMLSVFMAILTFVLILLNRSRLSLVALACSVILIVIYFYHTRKVISNLPTTEEIQRIHAEFEERFGVVCSSLVDMEARLETMQDDYNTVRVLGVQLGDEKSLLDTQENRLSAMVLSLTGERLSPDSWDRVLAEYEAQLKKFKDQADSIQRELASLNVDPAEYVESPPGLIYNRNEHQIIERQLSEIDQVIRENEQKLNTLKQLVCNETGDDISTDWETLIQHLRDMRLEIKKTYQEITAAILGKKAVQFVLDNFRQQEDKKIEEGLTSETILNPLYQITGRYKGLRLDNEQVIVSDDVNDFLFTDLSTGAQEQVLLALRIGFALKWLRRDDQQLFLLLDDAFQYSDWQRRKRLVQTVFKLAESGWQIFYFTMDDHLRELFDQSGKTLGTQYLSYELKSA